MSPYEGDSDVVESPTSKACRGCFSVTAVTSSILSKVPHARLLATRDFHFRRDFRDFWRRDHPIEASFSSFCEVMVGCRQPEQSQQMCLEELSFDGLQGLLSDSNEDSVNGPVMTTGLTVCMQPYLEDLLVRRQGFRGFVEILASVADADENLPQILSEVTAKDLFIALLLVNPNRLKRVRLATDYMTLKAPLPLVFRHPEWAKEAKDMAGSSVSSVSKAKAQAEFDLLQDIACVPREGRTLILSLGTEHVTGCGKTTLLGAMGLATPEDLDVRPSGPMHNLSCDLFCADPDLWLLDVHGSMDDDDLRNAVLAFNLWGSAVALVHCATSDFHSTGLPRKELVGLLNDLGSHLTGRQLRGSGVIILIRDSSEESFAAKRPAIESGLSQWAALVFAVEDCRNFRSAARRATAMDKLRVRLEDSWKTFRKDSSCGTSCLEDLRKIHQLISEGQLRKEAPATPKASVGTSASSLGKKLIQLLDRALKTPSLYETLFPLSAIKRRLRSLCHDSGAAPKAGTSKAEQLRLEEELVKTRAAKMKKLNEDFQEASKSEALEFFQSCLSSENFQALSALSEISHYLDAWKSPLSKPLLTRQRELIDILAVASETAQEETKAQGELNEVMNQLAELDFSADTFWTELELLATRESQKSKDAMDPKFGRAAACWASLLVSGHPFQVLHSRPLQMAGGFLRSVLASIGAPSVNLSGIYVVSVIGAQSSAKSTLLNFLFGSGFAVSSGRCTRGLYASYFSSGPKGRPVLVLDSEGLLSLGSEGSTFDGQIAMMCMTCSHLVLVNNKGELSRQLQDLLEICLFAMKHLRLSRIQPRLVFVLRDQHDRSRSVHEDMLKQMKNNLEDAAKTLGSPLQDLILLDGTAVFLLPSAMSSELRQGKEVCWTSELFAKEVLKLRSDVFRWLEEDCRHRETRGPVPEFSSLVSWFDYATTVWETLDQFGQQLLHCRTIHEIEQRRELADVAKNAVREALDGAGSADAGHAGFHERARQLVDSFVNRIHNPTRFDLETTDLELSRALAYLRDEFVARLEELFQQKASSPRFSTTAKEQARQQIRTPIEWAFENHLYTWKLHLKKASDERAMHELWIHFTGVLNRHLETSGHRSCLSEEESRELFDSEWKMYEASFLERLKGLTKDWQTLAHEVTLLFNHAVAKLHHETGALALLKEAGPQQLASDGRPLLQQSNQEWEEHFFHIGWWGAMKHGLALLQAGGNLSLDSTSSVHGIIPRMRQNVQHGLQQLKSEIHARGVLDEATAADALRHVANVMLNDLESRLLSDCHSGVTLKRAQILHALHMALRSISLEALEDIETEKQKKAMDDLLAQKALVEEHFLLIVQANKGDVERATNFATLYHRSLSSWLDHEVTQLAADVRSQVLQQMPDPQKSVEMAFQMSFGSRNWSDVLEYVLDTNAYLEKQFLQIFHQQKRSFVGAARSRVEKRIFSAYHLLQDVVGQWARKEVYPTEKVDIIKPQGREGSSTNRRSIKELKDFISIHAEHVPTNADIAEAHRQLAERLPATADFHIADPKLFAETLQARISDFADSREIPKRLSEQLQKALREQSLQAWSLIRGCSERCPLCGSKCDLVGEHSRHHCAHHLFPAFHGWMDRSTGLPSFHHCLSCDTREGTYECRDGTWRKLEEYLRVDHPSWLPFCTESAGTGDRDVQLLRAAWVNCREPLLEHFSPMADECPEEWVKSYQEEGRALSRKDLDMAKDTIRKLRLRRWIPPE